MTSTTRPLILALALATSATPAVSQSDNGTPSVDAILTAAAKAIGPQAETSSLTVKGTVEAFWVTTANTTAVGKGSFHEIHASGGRRLLRIEVAGVGTYAWGSDGKASWRIEPVSGATFRVGRNAVVDRLFADALRGSLGIGRAYHTTKSKIAQRELTTVHEVHGRRDQPKPDVWAFDPKSKLPSDIALQAADGLGQSRVWTVQLRDWQTQAGRRLPTRRTFRESHVELRMTATNFASSDAKLPVEQFQLNAAQRRNAAARAKEADRKLAAASAPLIRVRKLPTQHAMVIRAKVKPSEISLSFARILPNVMGYLARQKVRPTGAPFSIYHSMTADAVELEAGFPVAKPVAAKGQIHAVVMPAGEVASTWHVGPYHELGKTHTRMAKWMEKHGYVSNGPLREYYWTDPGLEPNPKKWRTEMVWPVKRKAK